MYFNFFHHSHATSSSLLPWHWRQRAQFMYDNDDEKLLYASFCSSYSLLTRSHRICLLARHNIIVKFSSSYNSHLTISSASSILMYTHFFLIFILNLKPKWRLQFFQLNFYFFFRLHSVTMTMKTDFSQQIIFYSPFLRWRYTFSWDRAMKIPQKKVEIAVRENEIKMKWSR